MKFKSEYRGQVAVINVEGNLMGGPDGATLNNKVHEVIEAGKKQVVVDLGGVQFINSSGLGLLIGCATAMKNADGGLRIANASEKILTVIKIAKLGSVLQNYTSIEKAIESFKQ